MMSSLKRKASTARDFLALFDARQTPDSVTKARKLRLSASPTSAQHNHAGFNRPSSVATLPTYEYAHSLSSAPGSTNCQSGMGTMDGQLASNAGATSNQIASSRLDPFNSYLLPASSTQQEIVAMHSTPEQKMAAMINPIYPDLFAEDVPTYFNDSIIFPTYLPSYDSNISHELPSQIIEKEYLVLQRMDSGIAIGSGPVPTTPLPKKPSFYRTSSSSPIEYCIDPVILQDTTHEISSPQSEHQRTGNRAIVRQRSETEDRRGVEEKDDSDHDKRIRLLSPITDEDELNADISPKFRQSKLPLSKSRTLSSKKKALKVKQKATQQSKVTKKKTSVSPKSTYNIRKKSS